MSQFFQFASEQWALFAALIALILVYFWTESMRSGAVVSVHQLTALVNNANAVVVDLREGKEYREGHIVDSVNIPFAKLAEQMSQLDKSRPVVLVDKLGQHSGMAGRQLKAAGFTVVRLAGGISEWTGGNLPLVKGNK